MDVHVRLSRRGELSEQIYRQLFEAILDGRLRPGSRLPPTRELAARLEVSRNTVGVAYERLLAEGVTGAAWAPARSSPTRRCRGRRPPTRRAPAGAVHPRDVLAHDARCCRRGGRGDVGVRLHARARRTTRCFRSPRGGGSLRAQFRASAAPYATLRPSRRTRRRCGRPSRVTSVCRARCGRRPMMSWSRRARSRPSI